MLPIPEGFIRPIPDDKREDYAIKFKEMGPFTKRVYDLDICVLYRQMDDLRQRNATHQGIDLTQYVEQIKIGVSLDLTKVKLDPELYLNHFYYVLTPANSLYEIYLGLFFSLCDPLMLIPLLNYHLEKYITEGKTNSTVEDFFNQMEFRVCDFMRKNRFPEDYYARHDKIMNWVFGKRDLAKYQNVVNSKLDLLIDVLNKISPTKISKGISKADAYRKEKATENIIAVIESQRNLLFKDLRDRFNSESHGALKKLLAGVNHSGEKIIFLGQANQLIDVFRIYALEKFIAADKRAIGKWICEHFMYFSDTIISPAFFDEEAVERVIYSKNPVSKDSWILLSGLPQLRMKYYRR
jgi:hypothetical protein